MKLSFKPGRFLSGLMQGFAVPAVICVLIAVISVVSSSLIYNTEAYLRWHDPLNNLFSAGWCGLCWTVADCCRQRKGRKIRHWDNGMIAAFIGILSVMLFPEQSHLWGGLALMMTCFCFHGICGKEQRAQRLAQVCLKFLTALGVSVVLFVALSLTVSAFTGLFLPDLPSRTSSIISSAVGALCFYVAAPWLFLGSLSMAEEHISQKNGFRRFAAFLLLPLYLMLLAVLLGYVVMILITWTMPVGVMNGYALTALALFTFFHLILTGEENKLSRLFTRWGGLALIPVLIAQAVGVWMRYDAYGFTASRIMGIAVTLLCAAVVISSIIGRRANWFFAAAGIMAAVVIASPFSADTLARLDQESRLESALQRSGMLTADGRIIANPHADPADREIIYSAIDYLDDLDAPDASLTSDLQAQLEAIREELDAYVINDACKLRLLGFRRSEDWFSRYLTYHGSASQSEVDTQGYNHAKWISSQFSASQPDEETDEPAEDQEPPFIQAAFHVADITGALDSFFTEDAQPVFPDVALTVTIGGEEISLNSLITGAEDVTEDYTSRTREYSVVQDEIALPSGKVFRLAALYICDYNDGSSLYAVDYITLNGWLLTPEAE